MTFSEKNKNRFVLGKKFGNEYLTNREIDIIKYVLQGFSAKEIGLRLNISHRTVESYISTIKLKCRCNRKSNLINFFIELGYFKILI